MSKADFKPTTRIIVKTGRMTGEPGVIFRNSGFPTLGVHLDSMPTIDKFYDVFDLQLAQPDEILELRYEFGELVNFNVDEYFRSYFIVGKRLAAGILLDDNAILNLSTISSVWNLTPRDKVTLRDAIRKRIFEAVAERLEAFELAKEVSIAMKKV